VQGWGPVWSSTRRGVATSAGRGARRLAFTALGAAVLAPIFVPGFGSQALVDFGTAAEDRVAIDPFVSVQHSLSQRTPVEVLRVSASRPQYIRLVSLPDFDGVLWRPEDADEGVVVPAGDPVQMIGAATGLTEAVSIDVTADLAQRWLPTPYPMTSIDAPGRTVRFDAETGTTFVDDPLSEGYRYTVTTSLVQPTADELRAVLPGTPLEGGRYLSLPEDTPVEIEALARSWTANASNDFDKALAIQGRFQNTSEFTYTVNTPLRAGTRSILEFLEESKRGFCQQFSTAMAVLLRSIDVQSRVVVGFASGSPARTTGQYSITTDRAHSWVEVFFPGWGWMPFEPTPTRSNPVTVAYTAVEPACPGPGCVDTGSETGGQPRSNPLDRSQRVRIGDDPRTGSATPPILPGAPATAPPQEPPLLGARTALLLAAIVGALVLLLMPPVRALRRKVQLRRVAAEPRRLILVTYEQFSERAAGLGLGRDPGETLEEYRRKVMETGYLSNGHLDRLTRLATTAAYSQHEPDGEQARHAGDAADTALREMRRAVGPARWLVGLYRRR